MECPDGIGLGCGVWEMPVRIKTKSSPHLCGGGVLNDRCHFKLKFKYFSTCFSSFVVVVVYSTFDVQD